MTTPPERDFLNSPGAANLARTFLVIRPDQQVDRVPVSQELYTNLDVDYQGFDGHQLVSWHTFDADWESWECHPAGDETVVLIDGEAEFVLALPDGDRTIKLSRAGDFAVVPKGVWHTAKTNSLCQALFITPGAGTKHRSA